MTIGLKPVIAAWGTHQCIQNWDNDYPCLRIPSSPKYLTGRNRTLWSPPSPTLDLLLTGTVLCIPSANQGSCCKNMFPKYSIHLCSSCILTLTYFSSFFYRIPWASEGVVWISCLGLSTKFSFSLRILNIRSVYAFTTIQCKKRFPWLRLRVVFVYRYKHI